MAQSRARTRAFALLIVVLAALASLIGGPAPMASAAGGVVIASPAEGATLPSDGYTDLDGQFVSEFRITGTVVPSGVPYDALHLFVNGKLLVPAGSLRTAPVGQDDLTGEASGIYSLYPDADGTFIIYLDEQMLRENGWDSAASNLYEVAQWTTVSADHQDPPYEVARAGVTFSVEAESVGSSDSTPQSNTTGGSGIEGPITGSGQEVLVDTGTTGTAGTGDDRLIGIVTGAMNEPSVLSGLKPIGSITLGTVAIAAVLTVILMLIVGFPGALIESTVSANHSRLFGWLAPLRARSAGARKAIQTLPAPLRIGAGVAAATLIACFVDPGFGFNDASGRMLISAGITFVVQSVLGWWLIARAVRRFAPGLRPIVEFKPSSLLIVLLAVVVSRLTGFEPGLVFGFLIGLSFGASLSALRQTRIVLVGVAWSFALGMVSWLAYSGLTAIAFDGTALGLLVTETFAGLAISAMASLPVALLPLAVFDGGTLFRRSRVLWATVYAAGLTAFLVVLMPLPGSWGEVGMSLGSWVAAYATYVLVAVGFWAFFRFLRPTRAAAAEVTPASAEQPTSV